MTTSLMLTCYFDYTCSYSYRTSLWLARLVEAGTPLEITWAPFVLKEVNRDDGEPSVVERAPIESIAVLALALGEALRGQPAWRQYHERTFETMHHSDRRATKDEVLASAEDAGLDLDLWRREETLWLQRVRESHETGVRRWGVFGTPNLIFDDDAALYFKLTELPRANDMALWDTVVRLAVSFPEVGELKRPLPP